MQDLIKIDTQTQTISARDLHSFLESKKQFADWIKHRIEKYGLIENQDYTTFHQLVNRSRSLEYSLTLDAAKELAMVEGNDKGKIARRYFIEKEKELRQIKSKPVSYIGLAEVMIQSLKEQEQRISQVEQKAIEIEARIDTIDTNFISVIGYARINNIQLPGNEALKIGKKAGRISREMGFTIGKVHDARYGSINTYHKDVLHTVFTSTSR